MKLTFHKWVLNAMTDPNPTQYTKIDKYKMKIQRMINGLIELYRFSNEHVEPGFVQGTCVCKAGLEAVGDKRVAIGDRQ